MTLSNDYRMKLVVVGIVAGIVLGVSSAEADFTFGEPTNLGPIVNSWGMDDTPSISADGLELYFRSGRAGGSLDIWVTTRETKDDEWGAPMNLGAPVNSSVWDGCPSISTDGLSLFFDSERYGGEGGLDIWVTTRPTKDEPWAEPVNLGPTVNSSAGESTPSISADGLSLYFRSGSARPGGYGSGDLWVTTRTSVSDPWLEPVNLGPTVNSSSNDYCPSISADGLCLFFGSLRSGGYGGEWGDLWVTIRPTKDDEWGEPVNLGPTVNSSYTDMTPSISADGSTLYFDSSRPGGYGQHDLWQAPIIPIVDFNGDGKVDGKDILTMMKYWYDDCIWCDIGPMPWGDGIVNIEDMKVLAGYVGEELNDPTLIAHWPLDETQGMTARESVGGHDDHVMGNPLWQPTGGITNGALQLDGVDDCVITSSGINPADGPFSIFAWINGGAPGQVFIAQQDISNWLALDADGKLMTDLKSVRSSAPLLSKTCVTDGNWHRIGLVWNGLQRKLYVDDVFSAADLQDGLEDSDRGLYIGVGKDYAPGTFFVGLIDDVRIYNRAISP